MIVRRAAVLFAALWLVPIGSPGQEVIAPPPLNFAPQIPGPGVAGTNQVAALDPVPAITADPLLRWGPVQFRPHLLFRFLYGDGLQAQPGNHTKSAIYELYPGLLMNLGDHWTLDYTPSMHFYSSSDFSDTLDHSVSLSGNTAYEDWTLGLSQGYSISSPLLVQTGTQTDQESFSTHLFASWQMTSRASLDLSLDQSLLFLGENTSQTLSDSKQWSTMDWANYQMFPQLKAGLGVGLGYIDMTVGSDMTYEQLQGRVLWHPGEKLDLAINGGAEIRQFLDSSSELVSPVFGASINYALFESTVFVLSASHGVSPSYFANQVEERTGFNATLRQRFLGKLYFSVGGGYGATSYHTTQNGQFFTRHDHYTSATVSLSAAFLKRGLASIFYQFSDNSSNESGFTYSSNQVGVEVGFRY